MIGLGSNVAGAYGGPTGASTVCGGDALAGTLQIGQETCPTGVAAAARSV